MKIEIFKKLKIDFLGVEKKISQASHIIDYLIQKKWTRSFQSKESPLEHFCLLNGISKCVFGNTVQHHQLEAWISDLNKTAQINLNNRNVTSIHSFKFYNLPNLIMALFDGRRI